MRLLSESMAEVKQIDSKDAKREEAPAVVPLALQLLACVACGDLDEASAIEEVLHAGDSNALGENG